tara:strand:+ start:3011 stop:4729 length:1719 start_codon:yes stop_codon:yes gene_type:complete
VGVGFIRPISVLVVNDERSTGRAMAVQFLANSTRAAEIIAVVTRHEWSFLRQLLDQRATDSPRLPLPEVLCSILTELGPVYVKLGQLLSTRADLLSEPYLEALSALQADVPFVPWQQIEPMLLEELGRPLLDCFSMFPDDPIAAGSIGQVYKATLLDGTPAAVKVLRPGIEEQVAEDGSLLRQLAGLASSTALGASYDLVGLADQVLDALNRELDFRVEAANTLRLQGVLERSSFVRDGILKVPQVTMSLTSQRVLVLEWIEGEPMLSDAARQVLIDAHEEGMQAANRALLGAFVEQYFLEGFFHADPHPGNLKVNDSGVITLLDEGMMGHFDPRTRTTLLDLVLALINQDAARATDLLIQLAPPALGVRVDRLQLQRQLDQLIAANFSKPLDELSFALFLGELLQLANRVGLRVPGTLGLFVKSVTNLEGVGRSLDPTFSFTGEMEPLVAKLLSQSLLLPEERAMQFGLDLRNFAVDAPRQLSQLLRRFSGDELVFALELEGLDQLRSTVDRLSRRLSLSILVAALLLSATVMTTSSDKALLQNISEGLFIAASLFGLWLIQSLLRSSRKA